MNEAKQVIIQGILETPMLAVDITLKHDKIIMLLNGADCGVRIVGTVLPIEIISLEISVVLVVRAFVQFVFFQIMFVFFAPNCTTAYHRVMKLTFAYSLILWNFFCVRNCVGLRMHLN